MTVYRWNFEIIFPAPNREPEIVRAGAVTTRKPDRNMAKRAIHRKNHIRDFFRLRLPVNPEVVRI